MISISYIVYNKTEKLFKAIYHMGDSFKSFVLGADAIRLISEFGLKPFEIGNLKIYKGFGVGEFRAIAEVTECEKISFAYSGGG